MRLIRGVFQSSGHSTGLRRPLLILYSLVIFLSLSITFVSTKKGKKKSSEEEYSYETSDEKSKKHKKPYKLSGPQFDFTGLLRRGFALELFLSKGIHNMACSPVSALMPLAKLAIGAEGKSQEELLKGIGVSKKSKISHKFRKIIKDLKYVRGVKLNVASRIYVSNSGHLHKEFTQETKKIFKSSVEKVNFNATETADKINSWVAKETGKTLELNLDFKVSGGENAVIVNVITFGGNWAKPFHEVTAKEFHSPTGIVNVPMMSQSVYYNYVKSYFLGAQVIEIPFEKMEASFIVVLPFSKTGLTVLMRQLKLAPELLNVAMQQMTMEKVVLSLPKFKIQSRVDLKPIYKSVGLHHVFSTKSGLTRIIKDQELTIGTAYQVSAIDVNEKGIEGASGTVVEMIMVSLNLNQVIFNANHPFMFYVKSKKEQIFAGVYAGSQ